MSYQPYPCGGLYHARDFWLNSVTGLQVILTEVLIKVKRLSFLSQMNSPWADSNFSTDCFHLGPLEGALKEPQRAWGEEIQKPQWRVSRGGTEKLLPTGRSHSELLSLHEALVYAGLQQTATLGLNVWREQAQASLHRLLILCDNRLRKQRLAWGSGGQSRVPADPGRTS